MSTSKKSWFEKAVTSIAAVTGVKSDRLAEIISTADDSVVTEELTFSQLADQVINDLASELNVPAEMATALKDLSSRIVGKLSGGAGDLVVPTERVDGARAVLTACLREAFTKLQNGGEITAKVWPVSVVSEQAKTETSGGLYEAVTRAACAEQRTTADVTEQLVEAVTAAPMDEPTTAEVQVEVVTPVVTTSAAKNTAHAAVKKAAAKKGKRIRTLSDMELLKAELAV